jgi:hypothetical protein
MARPEPLVLRQAGASHLSVVEALMQGLVALRWLCLLPVPDQPLPHSGHHQVRQLHQINPSTDIWVFGFWHGPIGFGYGRRPSAAT